MKTELEVLREARVRVDERWCQGVDVSMPDLRKNCLVVAMNYASDFYTREPVMERLRKLAGNKSLVTWNDTPGRTKDEVVALIDRAIAEVEAEQAVTV